MPYNSTLRNRKGRVCQPVWKAHLRTGCEIFDGLCASLSSGGVLRGHLPHTPHHTPRLSRSSLIVIIHLSNEKSVAAVDESSAVTCCPQHHRTPQLNRSSHIVVIVRLLSVSLYRSNERSVSAVIAPRRRSAAHTALKPLSSVVH